MKSGSSADLLPTEAGLAPPRPTQPIDLAHLRSFRIGAVEVRPASREVVRENLREVLEPRVMQVLVALASARGEILSRDDLIAVCWDGRAVSDDAINRVISRLRALARVFEAFEVETIVKVGYRLVGQAGKTADLPILDGRPDRDARRIDRRTLIVGGAALTATAVGAGILWRQPWRHRPPAEALDLYNRAQIAERQGVADQSRQTISFYEQAVRIDPRFGDAWGSLALAYTHLLEGNEEPDPTSLPGRIRSAAYHALQLDPENADARAALVMIKPSFHNWVERERQLRLLAGRYPRHWLIHGRLAILLYEVGRLSEGLEIHRTVLKIDPMLPIPYAFMVPALASLGRLDEAEAALKQALDRWPAHPALWETKFQFLLFSGRPEAAAAFLADPDSRPSGTSTDEIQRRARLARAVEYHSAADVAASLASYTHAAASDVTQTPFSAGVFAFLGQLDLAYASLQRYYFDRGSFGPSSPIGPLTRRSTNILFAQPFVPARADSRFPDLLSSVGLERYWRETGTMPDYRRTG
jgi:DNA-binding winged helix-turn-helix (wHTH) protein/tetratricopeptide (TPR) repeat protein